MPIDTSSYADPAGNKLLATASNDPNAALQTIQGVQQIAGQGIQNQRQQTALSADQINLGRQKLKAMNDVFGSIGPDPTLANAQQRISDAVASGTIDAGTAKAGLAQLMQIGDNPQGIQRWAFQHIATNQSVDQQLQSMGMGAPGLANVGDKQVPIVTKSGLNPSIQPAGGVSLQNGMSPGEASAPQEGPLNPDGSRTVISRGQYAKSQGVPTQGGYTVAATPDSPYGAIARGQAPAGNQPVAQPVSFGGGSPSADPTATPAAPGNGLVTPSAQNMPVVTKDQAAAATARVQAGQGTAADRNLMRGYAIQNNIPLTGKAAVFEPQPPTAAPAPTPQGSASASQPAPMTVGLAPGVETRAAANAAADTQQFQDVQRLADMVPQQKATISQMQQDLGSAITGPHAEAINTLKAGANVVADMANLPQAIRFDPKTIAATEKFRNASIQLAQQQFQALGGTGTDGQMRTASGDVPNLDTSKMGNEELLALNKGLKDAIAAKAQAANAYLKANPQGSYGDFAQQFNSTFSPRAYQLPYLSPDQRTAVISSMSPQERASVKAAFNSAVQKGYINPQGNP